MGNYSIKDLEKLSRVKAHTIRIWEKRYALLEPDRTDTNIRSYSDENLRKLLNISFLNNNGFKISKVAKMSDTQIRDQVLAMQEGDGGITDHVESLILSMTELDEDRFEKVMGSCVLRSGFETTMLEVIQPFLQRVGVLWQIDAVKPGQEHFISNLIRQKVISAIDGVIPEQRSDPLTILFFLPEGELHELGLLFGHYLARKLGHRPIYLGQSVPFDDLAPVVEYRRPDILVTGFISYQNVQDVNAYLKTLHKHFSEPRLLFFHNSGLVGIKPNKNQTVVPDLVHFKEAIR